MENKEEEQKEKEYVKVGKYVYFSSPVFYQFVML